MTEVALVGIPIPGMFSCPGLGRTGDESVRISYEVELVAFRNEAI